jgi:signal transduction histidine kinase
MNQPSVLIISDEADFSRMVVNRWQTERTVPAFTVVSSAVSSGAAAADYQVAIIGGLRADVLMSTLRQFEGSNRPVVVVAKDAAVVKRIREDHPRVLVLREYLGWVEALALVAGEALRRAETLERARKAEERAAANDRHATLGRYMLEMRHGLNNALTSVLGNAELLLLEPGQFSAEVRDQVDTIHTMALRIHEIVQRFSSLETEMNFTEKESHCEIGKGSKATSSGG